MTLPSLLKQRRKFQTRDFAAGRQPGWNSETQERSQLVPAAFPPSSRSSWAPAGRPLYQRPPLDSPVASFLFIVRLPQWPRLPPPPGASNGPGPTTLPAAPPVASCPCLAGAGSLCCEFGFGLLDRFILCCLLGYELIRKGIVVDGWLVAGRLRERGGRRRRGCLDSDGSWRPSSWACSSRSLGQCFREW